MPGFPQHHCLPSAVTHEADPAWRVCIGQAWSLDRPGERVWHAWTEIHGLAYCALIGWHEARAYRGAHGIVLARVLTKLLAAALDRDLLNQPERIGWPEVLAWLPSL
jgi:hypothetical protein